MIFRDTKSGYPIYIFNRDTAEMKTAKVVSVSLPHLDSRMGTGMVVDVMVEYNGNNATYTLNDNAEIGYANKDCVTVNRDCILREVEALKSQSENVIKSIDRHREIISKCDELMKELNPTFKEKAATEERFNKIESMLEKLLNNR